jgi:hypothetical protein
VKGRWSDEVVECGGESNTVARDNQHALRSAFCAANQESMAPTEMLYFPKTAFEPLIMVSHRSRHELLSDIDLSRPHLRR